MKMLLYVNDEVFMASDLLLLDSHRMLLAMSVIRS